MILDQHRDIYIYYYTVSLPYLDNSQTGVLEELVEDPAVGGKQFEEEVEVGPVRGLAVRGTHGEGEEVQHGGYHQTPCAQLLQIKHSLLIK